MIIELKQSIIKEKIPNEKEMDCKRRVTIGEKIVDSLLYTNRFFRRCIKLVLNKWVFFAV
jgi:hypothetical protein